MIISSEHHDLLEEYKRANEAEGAATKTLSEYMRTVTSDPNDPTLKRIFAEFEAAHEKTIYLYKKLKSLDLSK